ncbi:MAG: hypothetical protein GAK29_00422 [Acinetobacter bereziniae]|uniref:Uncharacterized protein n=1 Tax=Acinetobacter bereziniae TaxID=106648 RepID=A0A833PJ05_ACIBZ|nr:MAG: hypothetical protein GAK29_00422 [Acinetobacter bereziniae]
MRSIIAFFLFIFLIHSVQAAPLLQATISRESQVIGNDGVTHTSVFQERMYRDQNNVWLERVLPKHHQHSTDAKNKTSHKHLDLSETAQHYFLDNKKSTRLNLVLPEDKTVIHLQTVDIEMLGLTNCWTCVFSIFDSQSVKKMKITQQGNGYTWYESQNAKNKIKIKWAKLQPDQNPHPTSEYYATMDSIWKIHLERICRLWGLNLVKE